MKKTGQQILEDRLTDLAAGAAYHFFFSLFPFLLFATALAGLFVDEQTTVAWLMEQMGRVLPDEAFNLVQGVINDVAFNSSKTGLLSLGLLLAAWSGSNIFRSLMDTLNLAYDVTETRPYWKRVLLSLAALVGTGILILIASTVMLAGPEIIDWVGRTLRLPSGRVDVWMVLQYPIAFAVLVLAFFLIYRFLPNLRQSPRQILVGATVASVLWLLVTLVFRLYVTNFGSYNKTYGAIGAVIIVLTWMYLTMLVILIGGELNAELHRGTGSVHQRVGAGYAGRAATATGPSGPSSRETSPLHARGDLGGRGDEGRSRME